jgi:tetratricopeptide (TPR) repeat protein
VLDILQKNRWPKLLALLALGLGSIGGLAYWQAAGSIPLIEAEKLYGQGKTPQARSKLAQILKDHNPPVRAYLLMSEILLQEGDFEAAETHINPAIQSLQQAVHNGQNSEKHLLARAFFLKGLIRLAPSIQTFDSERDWDLLKINLQSAKESLEGAFLIDSSEPRYRAGHELVEAVERQEKWGQTGDRRGLERYKQFVQAEPLYQRLAPALPEATARPAAQPQSQVPIRERVSLWQEIKREAFLAQDITRLKDILTDKALTETIAAVQWWKNSEGAVYYGLELKKMKFLEIVFRDAEHCQARVEVEEMRNNSEEGQVNSQYRVRYELLNISEIWYISAIEVETQSATPGQ